MSMQLFSEMWERFPGKASTRTLKMSIAWTADEKGISVVTKRELAALARMSRTSAWRLLSELETEGWIEVEQAQTKNGPMKVQLMLARLENPCELPEPSTQRATPQRCRRSAILRSQQEELTFLL